MPAQPLSRVRTKANIYFGVAAFQKNPDLAILPLLVIARWSTIDGTLALLLAKMLKSDIAIGVAMCQALASGEARRDALSAAARASLQRADLNLFDAVMKVIKPSRDRRNEFAHHIWGYSEDIPNALLLAEPKEVANLLINFEAHNRTKDKGKFAHDLDRSRVKVFKLSDLEEDSENSRKASEHVSALQGAIPDANVCGRMRQKLLRDPDVRQAFEKLSNETP